MSVTLEDSQQRSMSVNAWNWGVLHFTLECERPPLFEADLLTRLRSGGAVLTEEQVGLLRGYLEEVVLPRLQPGQRMLHDFSVTDEPDDGTFYRDQLEKNYSLRYEVLVAVIEFLTQAQPPVEVW